MGHPFDGDHLTASAVRGVSCVLGEKRTGGLTMPDPDLAELRQQAQRGDQDAVDQLVELAGERGDRDELRRLAASGHQDAVEVLAELDEDPTNVEVE